MEDTDQMLRVTTPFIRPGLETLGIDGPLDFTPTTAPGNTPGTPRRRLARGTVAPPVEVLTLPAPALPVRLIDPPTRWGYRVRVDLDAARFLTPPELAPVSGEIDTAPVRRIEGTPWRLVVPLAAAILVVLSAIYVVLNDRRSTTVSEHVRAEPFDSAATQPRSGQARVEARAAVPPTVVIPLPAEPAVAPADEADEHVDDADEIEMPAHDIAPAVAAPAGPATPAATHGTLMIGSKPPCRILVDGKDTGLTTPNRSVRVPAGRRTITLVNDDLGIRHSETLTITGGRKAKMIRDLTDRIDS